MASYESDPHFSEIVKAIKKSFSPKKLYLFGSRATDHARPDSDYDFVVVVEKTEKTRIENLIEGQKISHHLPMSLDTFVYPESEFNEWKNEFNSIPEIAMNMGVEINLDDF